MPINIDLEKLKQKNQKKIQRLKSIKSKRKTKPKKMPSK